MEQSKFVLINFGVVTILLLLFALRKKPKNPTPLNLGIKPDIKAATVYSKPAAGSAGGSGGAGSRYSKVPPGAADSGAGSGSGTSAGAAKVSRARNLNCIFVYNGHSWDSYEVLGIPAGAPVEMAKAALEELRAKTAEDSHEFLAAALDAIIKQNS